MSQVSTNELQKGILQPLKQGIFICLSVFKINMVFADTSYIQNCSVDIFMSICSINAFSPSPKMGLSSNMFLAKIVTAELMLLTEKYQECRHIKDLNLNSGKLPLFSLLFMK